MLETAQRRDPSQTDEPITRTIDQWFGSHFTEFCPVKSWTPTINAYQMPDSIEVCVDLAGVAKESIDLRIEPGKLWIRGVRRAPEPPPGPDGGAESLPVQILAMEIDHGPFERALVLPREVNVDAVTAEQRNGLLWIRLPLRVSP